MERDFTEEVEQQMLEMVDTYDIMGALQDTDEKLDEYMEYLDNWCDIEYTMQHIEAHKQFLIQEGTFDAETIQNVFHDVREYDAEYQNTIEKNTDEFFTPYLESLKGLLETIRVSGEGKPYTNAEDFAIMVQNQYEKNGYICGAGMFSSTDLFSIELEALGGGVVKACYLSIKDIEGDEFQELINKPMEDIKPWEVAALSMVYDDCVDEKGNVDVCKLQELVNRCYIVEQKSKSSGGVMGFYESAHVRLAPVMSLLNYYRTDKSAQMSMLYGNADTRITYKLSKDDVMACCYISDVIFTVDTYYNEYDSAYMSQISFMQNGGTEAYKSPVNISINTKDNVITMNFFDRNTPATIYGYTMNLIGETNESDAAITVEDMDANPKKTAYLNTGKFAIEQTANYIPGLNAVNNAYGFVSGAYNIYSDYKEALANNEECMREINCKELQRVAYTTGCSGTVVQCGDRYDVRNLGSNSGQVIQDIALYNEAVKRDLTDGEVISDYQEVQAELNDYTSGRKTWEECRAINDLYDFDKAEKCYVENSEQEVWYNYSYYAILIGDELGTGKERDYTVHTNSEVEEASKIAARKWCDHMEGK